MNERRRWGRIKVPDSKLSCRIAEPAPICGNTEFIVDNINPGGLSFFSDKKLEEQVMVHLSIKFPFTTFEDSGNVWGRITYCLKIHDQEKYLIGIAFVRRKTECKS